MGLEHTFKGSIHGLGPLRPACGLRKGLEDISFEVCVEAGCPRSYL